MSILAKDHLGNTYKSLSAMATEWNIPNAVLYNRLNKGWSIKDCLTIPVKHGSHNNIPVFFENKGYDSIQTFCLAVNINYYAFIKWIERGWSIEKTVSYFRNKQEKKHGTKI